MPTAVAPLTSVLERIERADRFGRVRTATGDAAGLLPVAEPLQSLLPGGGLRPGSVVAVRGSTALVLALLAEATAAGHWAAVVGMPDLGVLAAVESGIEARRLALLPAPGNLAAVVAALLDGIGLVAVSGTTGLPAGARRSLTARARQRGGVLIPLGAWPGADLELGCRTEAWAGPVDGHGRLRSREVLVRAVGRGAAARPRTERLLLPGPGGSVARAGEQVPVPVLSGSGGSVARAGEQVPVPVLSGSGGSVARPGEQVPVPVALAG